VSQLARNRAPTSRACAPRSPALHVFRLRLSKNGRAVAVGRFHCARSTRDGHLRQGVEGDESPRQTDLRAQRGPAAGPEQEGTGPAPHSAAVQWLDSSTTAQQRQLTAPTSHHAARVRMVGLSMRAGRQAVKGGASRLAEAHAAALSPVNAHPHLQHPALTPPQPPTV